MSANEELLDNYFRRRMKQAFKLTYPLNEYRFKKQIHTDFPITKILGINFHALTEDESVFGIQFSKKHKGVGTSVHTSTLSTLNHFTCEMALRFNLPDRTYLNLILHEFRMVGEITGGVMARCEWKPEERGQLLQPKGTIFKGVAMVNEKDELCAKSVLQWTWQRSNS